MKKLVLFLLASFVVDAASAQNALTITPGTDLYLSSSNILNIEGLSLTPSAPFTISGASIAKNSAITNSGLSNTVARAYLFSATSAPFSGIIRVYYTDAERGSLNESSLQVQGHNGTAWQSLGATARDGVDNYVEVSGVTGRSLAEVTLNVNTILPLTWKGVTAERRQNNTVVQWETSREENVSHFSVERSVNGESWRVIGDHIKATNSVFEQQYAYTDADNLTGKLLYRIRQTDRDGRFSYSQVVLLSASNQSGAVRLYPNPAANTFSLQLSNPSGIKELQLYHSSGMLIQKWQRPQTSYSIEHLPRGMYQLLILEKDGNKHYIPLIKN